MLRSRRPRTRRRVCSCSARPAPSPSPPLAVAVLDSVARRFAHGPAQGERILVKAAVCAHAPLARILAHAVAVCSCSARPEPGRAPARPVSKGQRAVLHPPPRFLLAALALRLGARRFATGAGSGRADPGEGRRVCSLLRSRDLGDRRRVCSCFRSRGSWRTPSPCVFMLRSRGSWRTPSPCVFMLRSRGSWRTPSPCVFMLRSRGSWRTPSPCVFMLRSRGSWRTPSPCVFMLRSP